MYSPRAIYFKIAKILSDSIHRTYTSSHLFQDRMFLNRRLNQRWKKYSTQCQVHLGPPKIIYAPKTSQLRINPALRGRFSILFGLNTPLTSGKNDRERVLVLKAHRAQFRPCCSFSKEICKNSLANIAPA